MQEPEVRSQEPEVRSQEPEVRSRGVGSGDRGAYGNLQVFRIPKGSKSIAAGERCATPTEEQS